MGIKDVKGYRYIMELSNLIRYEKQNDQNSYITGSTGSLGYELVRKVQELKEHHEKARFLMGEVRDKDRLTRAAEDIDITFHTVALRHILACGCNPFDAVKKYYIC